MKTRKIRLLSALLALAMLLALLPTAAFAAGDTTYTNSINFNYTLDSENNATITGVASALPADGVVVIPAEIDGKPVIAIGEHAFQNSGLTAVDMSGADHLEIIGEMAFLTCKSLNRVDFPQNGVLKTIGEGAFSTGDRTGATFTELCIPASVETIGYRAFGKCSKLETVTFAPGSKLKEIVGDAFFNTALESITIPEKVTTIGSGAFEGCSKLKKVTFAPDSKLETIGNNAFKDCHKDLIFCYSDESGKTALKNADVSPDLIKPAKPTVTFDSNNGSKVDSQKVANGKTATEPAAPTKDGYIFAGWYTDGALTEKYDFSKAVKDDMTLYAKWNVGGDCGKDGSDVKWELDTTTGTLTISGTGKMADYDNTDKQPWANQRSSINKVVIGDGVTSIGQYAFALCKSLSEITIPAKVERIGEYAFYDCYDHTNHSGGLTTVTFAENSCLTTIEEYAFYRCMYLKKIEIPASVTSIGGHAFNSCENLKELAFAPNSQLKSIGEYAFGAFPTDTVSPAYTSVQIPASVTEIGQNAFYRCTELKTVEFEEGSQLKALGDVCTVPAANGLLRRYESRMGKH